uniref:Asteroid homolog 1 n=1 Tax=Leptobrachium leishanense TaxID=445787 RepID=A0A8C5MXJ9_9ANUR
MGVQGLTSFVASYSHLHSDVKLRNTKLVIDGNSLYHKLYLDSDLGQIHGGNYDAFTDLVRVFFGNLEMCDICAYIVLDGGNDVSDRKFGTQKQRLKDKIKMADKLSRGGNGQVLPLMVRDVFLQILRKLQVNVAQCFFEADREAAALANKWNCPVLTMDSDFCIFNVRAGYCPFNHFQWRNIVVPKQSNECFINAKRFSARVFCKYFKVDISLLPLFAVLAGNDYVAVPSVQKAISTIQAHIVNRNRSGNVQSCIKELLAWLSEFDHLEDAIDNALKYLGGKDLDQVLECLKRAMDDYDLCAVENLEHFFRNGSYLSVAASQLNVPNWVQSALVRGQLAPMLSDALVLKRTCLHVQVENMKRPSAHSITQPIRQVMYGLILNVYQDLIHNQQPEQPEKFIVSEFFRQETNLMRNGIEAIVLPREFGDLSLEKLPEVPLETRLNLFLGAFRVNINSLESVPPAHWLTVAATCFWVANASPKVRMHHLKALVMGIVCGQAFEMMAKKESLGEDPKLLYNKLKTYKKWREPRGRRRSDEKPIVDDLHLFCQWQCCLQTGLHFNQLLCTPLQEPDVTRIYNGILVSRLCHNLKSDISVEDLFKPAPVLDKLYRDCVQAVISSFPPGHFQKRSKSSKSKKEKTTAETTKDTKDARVTDSRSSSDVGNRFAALCLEETD